MSTFKDRRIGFKVRDVIEHFKTLKESGEEKWWSEYLQFEWNNVRNSSNTKWVSIKYRNNLTTPFSRFSVVIVDELHIGQIMPATDEDVAEIKEKNPDSRCEKRQTKASLQIQKWSKMVQTQEDRISLVIENGKPVLPEEKYLSNYFQVASFIDEAFKYELKERIERYTSIILYLAQHKKCTDTIETIQDIRKTIGHVKEGDTIIQDSESKSLKEKFPNTHHEFIKGFIIVNNTKLFPIVQEYISEKAIRNKGMKLPNPMTRITIPFDFKTLASQCTILDKNKPFTNNGRIGYEQATVNDLPINSLNVHKFITSRCVIDGIINMDSMCFSQLGISVPVKVNTIIVKQPEKTENNILNICENIYDFSINESMGTENKTVDELLEE
jgi:hypothetical protein